MYKTKPVNYLVLVLSLWLASCNSSVSTPTSSLSPTLSEVQDTVTAPAPTTKPNSSPSVKTTKEPVPSPTQLEAAEEYDIPLCEDVGSQIGPQSDFRIDGTIFYYTKESQSIYKLGGFPIKSTLLVEYKDQVLDIIGLSPDGKWLAYSPHPFPSNGTSTIGNLQVILLSENGLYTETFLDTSSLIEELPAGFLPEELSSFSYWINNRFIYSDLVAYTQKSDSTWAITTLPKVLDTTEGTWATELLKKIPRRYRVYDFGISPDLTRALIYSNRGLILWDMLDRKVLWEDKNFRFTTSNGGFFIWSSDSSWVALVDRSTLSNDTPTILISRDGEERDFLSPDLTYIASYIKWSPNSKYLAIIDQLGKNLLLYDNHDQKFDLICPLHPGAKTWPFVVWSPDNKYIAFSDGSDIPLKVINVETKEMFELGIDKDIYIFGWSELRPEEWWQAK